MAELTRSSCGRRPGTVGPPSSAPVRVLLWLGVRAAQIGLYALLGWSITAVTHEQFLDNAFTAMVGIGVFAALPVTVLLSVIAWVLPSIVGLGRQFERCPTWLLFVASAVEFVASLFLFIAWLPNQLPVLVISMVLALALTLGLPLSLGWRPRGRPS